MITGYVIVIVAFLCGVGIGAALTLPPIPIATRRSNGR